jgi:polynucleotide 5'-kinase involved in rRNA processing
VRPTVFAPTLPAGLDLARLDRMLVGLQDATGRCRGLGTLEYGDEALRVITNGGEDMRGLRLGSVRVDLDDFSTERVRLRNIMFGMD